MSNNKSCQASHSFGSGWHRWAPRTCRRCAEKTAADIIGDRSLTRRRSAKDTFAYSHCSCLFGDKQSNVFAPASRLDRSHFQRGDIPCIARHTYCGIQSMSCTAMNGRLGDQDLMKRVYTSATGNDGMSFRTRSRVRRGVAAPNRRV